MDKKELVKIGDPNVNLVKIYLRNKANAQTQLNFYRRELAQIFVRRLSGRIDDHFFPLIELLSYKDRGEELNGPLLMALLAESIHFEEDGDHLGEPFLKNAFCFVGGEELRKIYPDELSLQQVLNQANKLFAPVFTLRFADFDDPKVEFLLEAG